MNYFNIQKLCTIATECVVFVYVNRPKIYFLNVTNRLTFELETLLSVKQGQNFLTFRCDIPIVGEERTNR